MAPNSGVGGAAGSGVGGVAGSGATTGTPALTNAVAVGDEHSCELKSDGTVACWGSNQYGASTALADTFVQLAAGSWQNCGVRTDGSIACWGFGYNGAPTYTAPAGSDFVQVSLGRYVGEGRHACALRSNGQIVCWQDDDYGETEPPSGTFKQVSAGHGHTCGLRTDDKVVCWGENDEGQSRSPAGTFQQVSCGDNHNCGVLTTGSVACWGYDFQGDTTPPSGSFRQVSAGSYYSCGVRADGTLACWGANPFVGQPTPSGTFTDVTLGGWEACARRVDGSILCWNGDGVSTAPPPPPSDPAESCPGFPAGAVCQCGGFTLPNSPGTGLPHPSSYIDNGDGTITDQVTTLLWEKAPNPSVQQCPGIVQNGGCSAAQATAYCTSKGTGWRLPTRLELESLVDVTIPSSSTVINPIFPQFDTARDVRTSTSYGANDPELMWFVRFLDGSVRTDDTASPSLVRCVKGTPNCYAARYQILASSALVYDQATGLTWQQAVLDASWDAAGAACATMGQGWRLPNLLELQSIVDDSQLDPSIDGTAFPNAPAGFYWSSAVSPRTSVYGWAVDFGNGGSAIGPRTSTYHVRCVR